MYKRYLKLELLDKESAFLWGARKTGKSTFLKGLYPNSVRFDLLNADLRLKYSKEPWKFRLEILALEKDKLKFPIIVDEVQKVTAILDEIHWLIENEGCSFIMCGSSSRQMKRAHVNMLGGRALKYHFFPLVYPEIKEEFDLQKIFNNGLIPMHYGKKNARKYLSTYIEDFLIHEIQAEGLARNLQVFSRFLDSVAFSHGEMLNYSNIARDCGIDSKTVKEYYQILVDTLIGYLIYPYSKTESRAIISASPKFYLFDVGIANRHIQRTFENIMGVEAGKSLEQYIFLELYAYIKMNDLDYKISYWRTRTGTEVDFIIHLRSGRPVPIEVKISHNIHKTELRGLKSFMKEHDIEKGYLVCMEDRKQRYTEEGEIIIYPVREFLEDLWTGKIIKE
jgi:uncharacterized protein